MKNMSKFITLLILMCITFTVLPTSVFAADLADFDIKTANATTVTAESIDANFKKNGGEIWQGTGSSIMDISKATGINASFLVAKLIGESGWAKSSGDRVYKTNNPGNITGSGNDGSWADSQGREWAKYTSMEVGIKATAELLDSYYTKDNLKTLKKVLEKYAPESDNNNHTQMMANIQSIAKGFGQDLSTGGSINVGSGEYEETKEGGEKVGELMEPMIKFGNVDFASPSEYNKGIQTSDDFSASLVTGFSRFASNVFEKSKIITAFMTVALIAYMFTSIGLVLIGYNGLFGGNDMITKASDLILGEGIEYNRQGLFKLFKRTVIGLFIMAIAISGVYVLGYVFIYEAIMYF